MARGGGKDTPERAELRRTGDDEEPEFEPQLLLAALAAANVRFVVIGLLAAVYQGAQEFTEDVDVTPERETRNLARLADALKKLDAVVLDSHGKPLPDAAIDDQHLRIARVTHLRTRHGKIDIVLNPAGANGYDDLVEGSLQLQLPGGQTAQVAALKRVIESKRAADRPKDRAMLPTLERLLREQEGEHG